MKVSFEIEHTCLLVDLSKMAQQEVGDVGQEQGQVGGVGDSRLFDIHEIFQTPDLFGVSEIELDLEAQRVIIDEQVEGKIEIAAE